MLVGFASGAVGATLDRQRKVLLAEGCDRVIEERRTTEVGRPPPSGWLAGVRAGDTVVVSSLDKLGVSVGEVVARLEALRRRGVGVRSLSEAVDSESLENAGVFMGFGILAEVARALRRERVAVRLRAVKERGQRRGRRKRLTSAQRAHAVELYRSQQHTVKEICVLMGVSRSTLYAYVQEQAELEG